MIHPEVLKGYHGKSLTVDKSCCLITISLTPNHKPLIHTLDFSLSWTPKPSHVFTTLLSLYTAVICWILTAVIRQNSHPQVHNVCHAQQCLFPDFQCIIHWQHSWMLISVFCFYSCTPPPTPPPKSSGHIHLIPVSLAVCVPVSTFNLCHKLLCYFIIPHQQAAVEYVHHIKSM